jgi:hypothetical protein
MSDTIQAGAAAGAADPSVFDFDSYISGVATFPEFQHTVFLDQKSGIELHELASEYDKLADRGREIMRIQSNIADSSTRSLVDEEAEELAAELGDIEEKTAELAPKINELKERIRRTALTLNFQAGTAQKLGSVIRQAEKAFHKKHGRKAEDDIEYVTARSKALLAAQLSAYCTKIILADGREQDPPSDEGFLRLIDSLISSESMRLMLTLNKSLDSSANWAETIDAGFPGGRDEPEAQPVDHPGPEDIPFLVGTTPDAVVGGSI